MSNHTMHDLYQNILFEYISGALDDAQNFAVRTHLGLSPRARAFIGHYDALGAAMIERYCQPVSMQAGALESVMQRLERHAQKTSDTRVAMLAETYGLPTAVLELLRAAGITPIDWIETKRGTRRIEIPIETRHSRTRFIRLSPGTETPAPRRRSVRLEMTVVLDGAYEDENGTHKAGDLVIVERSRKTYHAMACERNGCTVLSVRSSGDESVHSLIRRLFGL